MSAPPDITTLDISGTYVLNKNLSSTTEMDLILQYQGVGWFKRKAISLATLTLIINHYKDDGGVEHIDIDQSLSGGVGATTERRTLDWIERKHDDSLFGSVIGKSHRVTVEEIEDEFLKQNWLPDVKEHGAIHSYVVSDTEKSGTSWTAEQIWGFEETDGERRYARHVKFTGPANEHVEAIMAYDYAGPK